MSISQDEIREFNSPSKSKRTRTKKNKVTSPVDQSPVASAKKDDGFELFTVKTPSKYKKTQILPSDSQDTSELSDDVFLKQKPVSISTPSKSDAKSYRERINERFKSVKEKAGKSTRKANVFKEATEKILLEKVKRESSDIDAELESMRNKLKLGKTPENRDVYNFFCSEKYNEKSEDEEEENFKSTANLTDDNSNLYFAWPKQSGTELKKSEEVLFFKPRAQPVNVSDKIDTEEPRFLEDEGFYVPPLPKIASQHLLLLEQRLSRDDTKWFNCDGSLKILENPYRKNSYRPPLKHLPISEITTYSPAKIEESDCEEVVVVRENLLELEISSLEFTHHPLFSKEHVLTQKLKKLYREYEESFKKNELLRLTRRLEGLRRVLKKWEEVSSQSGDQSDKEDDRIEAYKRDIRILQEQVFDEGKKERDRTKSILQTWKDIKRIRESNKYSSTAIKLLIRKEKVNYEEDKENYEKNFEDTFDEYLEYNRGKSRSRRQNEDDIREELVERFKESYRSPGEPILHFSLANDNEISKIVENSKEITRRNMVSSTKICLKIICNNMEVCKTKLINLQEDFSCNFDENITIQLINIPKVISIEIIEQPKSLIKRTIGEIIIKIPAKFSSKKTKKTIDFEKNEIVHYKHEGVGSGIKLEELGFEEELHTSGFLSYCLIWDVPIKSEENSLEDKRKIVEEIIDKNGSINTEKLSEWMHQHKPDPQDPRNSVFYEYSLDSDDVITTNNKKYFRLNQLEQWQFCDQKILEDNLRLKILQLRNRNEPEFDRMVVPNRIKEIPLDILADYRRRIANERENLTIEEDEDEEDEIEKRRSKGRKYLKQIQIKVFQKCKNSQNNLTFENVVDEKLLPQFEKMMRGMATSFLGWFQWRPLTTRLPHPIRKSLQEIKAIDYDLQSQVKVVINVISGLNIPVKIEDKKETVEILVEAEYNGQMERTTTKQGPHPIWNETLTLTLEPSHLDYLNPNSLNGTIVLNVFDENGTALMKFSGQKCRNWLGDVEIPLSAVCHGGIQGMFKVKVPHFLLGYRDKSFEENKSSKNTPQTTQQSYLNLQIKIEPNIPKLNPAIKELACSDIPYIQDHALAWNENFNVNFPNRKFSVFAIDSNATTTCIVRYIKPLEPPQINVEGFDVTPEQCVRYISLIPFTDCNEFYKNIWLPVDKFLHFMIGSVIDHAVALTCYLLALKLEAWLLLGFGIPYGTTAFVLIKEYDINQVVSHYLFDVVQGEKLSLTDAFCPLQKVYCVVNEQNVWANIQRSDDVTTMRFDLTRRSDWWPLFENKISAPTNSIHGKITYLSKPIIDELEIIIDRKIRKCIAKLRQLDRTIWNHRVSNTFKNNLASLEKKEMYGKGNSEALDKINDCIKVYKMRGHIINLPFSNVSSIIKKIKMFGLHLEEENTQYASAVYVRAYSNQVLTIWVFLAVIKAQTQDEIT